MLGAALAAALFVIPFKAAADGGHGKGAALGLLLGVVLWFAATTGWRWRRASSPTRRQSLVLAAKLALAAAIGNVAQGLAFSELHGGIASVLLQTHVLWVTLLGWLWLREPIGLRLGFGVALTVGGVLSLHGGVGDASELRCGVLWAVLAAASFALLDALARRHMQGTDTYLVNTGRAALAALLIGLLPGAWAQLLAMGPFRLGACLLAALIGPGLARLLILSAARELPATENALIQQLRPVVALPLASVVWGHWPAPHEWRGCLLILLGVTLPLLVERFGGLLAKR